jgi:histidyl-tRNA synthetase
MKIPPVKGTRDFYPEDLAPLRRLFDVWRAASLRHGFVEIEGPTLEPLELYVRKSGDEIVGQLFHLEDRAGRKLALRPELTPSLARMIAARLSALPRPIKWFSIPRLYRGERPQRGRLREFFQWNVDIVGVEEEIADAECIAVGVEALRDLGLKASDVVVRVSDRRLIAACFDAAGVPEEQRAAAYALLDKSADLERGALAEQWAAGAGRWLPFERLEALLGAAGLEEVRRRAAASGAAGEALEKVIASDQRLWDHLEQLGVADYCTFDLRVVRGLAYYTGAVFEGYDRAGQERAIFGGGRYDQLLRSVGGGDAAAVGFGMGDVVLQLMLADRGLLKPPPAGIDAFVIDADAAAFPAVLRLAAELRRRGLSAEYDFKRRPLGKQLSGASSRGARYAVIVRSEHLAAGTAAVKDLTRGAQADIPMSRLTTEPPDRWLQP